MKKKISLSMRLLPALLLMAFAALLLQSSSTAAGTLKDDAYIQSGTPNQNFGANANLRVASGVNSYLRFDLSTLPAGTAGGDVAKATLRLWVNTVTTPGSFDVRRVTGVWTEGTLTFVTAPSLGSTEITGVPVSSQDNDSFITIDLTTVVKDWLNGVLANNGIALVANAVSTNIRFDSKENGQTSHEPRLEITLKGPKGLNWKGAWSSTTNYVAEDAVSYNGSSWIAKQGSINILPTEGAVWTIIAQKGDTGATGATGPMGPPGPAGPAGSSVSLGSFSALTVMRASSASATATATEITLEDSSNNKQTIRNLNVTVNIGISGENGLDSGTEAPNTWYFFWVIRKSADGTVGALLSTSPSSPVLPPGYDQRALVSVVRNDGSSNFVDFLQRGRRYNYRAWQKAASGNVGGPSWSPINIEAYVPSALSDFCYGSLGTDNSVAYITNDNTATSPETPLGEPDRNVFGADFAVSSAMINWQFDILTANTLWWTSRANGDEVWVHGFEINKL